MSCLEGDRLLFIGDSITDAGRDRADDTSLGDGYVRMVAERLPGAPTVINKGLNGNRIYDMEARWSADVLELAPTVLTVKIGINDTWRRYDRRLLSPIDEFAAAYRRVLTRTRETITADLVIITPFLLPLRPGQSDWQVDLSPRIDATLEIAETFGARVVRADLILASAAEEHGAAALVVDGVHPTALGHRILAEAWLGVASYRLSRG